MHYFYYEPELPRPTRCDMCGRWFLPGEDVCSALNHVGQGNGCCHLGDTEVDAPAERTAAHPRDLGDVIGEIRADIDALKRRADKVEAAVAGLTAVRVG